jgi:predicted transcriptional regulator
MNDLKIHIGESASLAAMGDRFIAAWRRAEAGDIVAERHLSFGSLQELAAVLTPRRLALLRSLHADPAQSIRTLAGRLGRDYSNVHGDVQVLIDHGLVDRDDAGRLQADYDEIKVDLALAM